MMTVLSECWQRWDDHPHNHVSQEERVWFKELNQTVFSGLEKKLVGRVKVYSVNAPAFLCHTHQGEAHTLCVNTELVHLSRASFDENVLVAIDRLDELSSRDPVAVFYQLLAPMGTFDHDEKPNRRHLGVRMRSLPSGCSPV